MDAAHFVHGAFLGFLWSLKRIFIPSPSGRQRFNVLGALNAVTNEIVTVTNTTYVNSLTVCEMLDKLIQSTVKPITVILDNAKYQQCNLVKDYAKKRGIELLFLPSYSPQLNLIERFWKFTKGICLYCKYYKYFKDFKTAIADFISLASTVHSKALKNLLTWNFQDFSKVDILTV